ncbi:MAG: lipopolysaccharide heptosyltransferase II [Gemmatimonadetes bacterium GWC2_71_10]|nr:MAG: lipopolysaccharide heptosyltransferase II [Gemmatimonadetes bacterium GWC2_71_10]
MQELPKQRATIEFLPVPPEEQPESIEEQLKQTSRASVAVQRGLVIQTAFPGDVILTTPLIRRAAERTGAPVDVITTPVAAPVLANNPHIREVLVYDKRGRHQGVGAWWRLAQRLRLRRYSVAYLAQASLRSSLLAWAARIPRRIGFRGTQGAWLYTHAVTMRGEPHQVERLLALADGAPDRREPEIYPSNGDRRAGEELLEEANIAGPFIAIAPGSQWGTKRWPYFAELARALALELPVAIVGGPADRADARAIKNALGAGAPVADAVGRLSLLASGELIRRAAMLVSNDSAPVHLASATNTPTIELFGPTIPGFGFAARARFSRIVEPDPLPCRPCSHHGPAVCPLVHHRCMRDTPIARVLADVRQVLQIVRQQPGPREA